VVAFPNTFSNLLFASKNLLLQTDFNDPIVPMIAYIYKNNSPKFDEQPDMVYNILVLLFNQNL
jgi:hypothetical protein